MQINLSKTQAKEKIEDFFRRKDFTPEEARKIRRLAMKFNIKLGKHRRCFCKKCLAKLKGKTRITKTHKIIECDFCGFANKFRLRRE